MQQRFAETEENGEKFLINVGTGKKLYIPVIQFERKGEHPSIWFTKNTGKPPITIYGGNLNIDTLASRFRASLKTQKPDQIYAEAFLAKFLQQTEMVLAEDWISYERVIGNKGEKVNPLSMYEITLDTTKLTDTDVTEANKSDYPALAFIITYIYRFTAMQNIQHSTTALSNRAKELLASLKYSIDASILDTLATNAKMWLSSETYLKLIAGVDMYFSKYPNLDLAIIKFGTAGSRFKGCAALTSFENFRKVADFKDLIAPLSWIWDKALAEDINRTIRNKEEFDKPDSYFPYQMDMKLTTKSAYSVSINQPLHLYCNVVGSLLNDDRSKHARLPCNMSVNLHNILTNATITAYAIHRVKDQSDNVTDDDEADGFAEPTSKDGEEWFRYARGKKFELGPKFNRFLRERKLNLMNQRKGSIGEFLGIRL